MSKRKLNKKNDYKSINSIGGFFLNELIIMIEQEKERAEYIIVKYVYKLKITL